MSKPKPSNLALPDCLYPEVADLWEVYEETDIAGPGRGWRVACKLCGRERVMSTAYLNHNMVRCGCYSTTKKKSELTYEGLTRPLAYWSDKFGINLSSMRNRYHDRQQGKTKYTDAEVIFGPRRAKTMGLSTEITRDAHLQKARFLAQGAVTAANARLVEDLMSRLTPLLSEKEEHSHLRQADIPYRPQGYDFPIDLLGLTLGEILDESGIDSALSALRSEEYGSLEEKQGKVSPFIPLLDLSDPHALTDGEQLQLLAPSLNNSEFRSSH